MTDSNRLDRIEASLERSTNLLERVVPIQEQIILTQVQQQSAISALTEAARNHETKIARQRRIDRTVGRYSRVLNLPRGT